MTTSILIANNGPNPVYVMASDNGHRPTLLVELQPGHTTKPEHCHVFAGRMIVVSETKFEDMAEAVDVEDDDEPTESTEPTTALKAGDKL